VAVDPIPQPSPDPALGAARAFPKLQPLEAPGAIPARRVSFIVPAHNEERTIGEVLQLVSGLDLDKQVIVVDDGSTDGTSRILEAWERNDEVQVVRQANRGKGAAIRAAIPGR
jgi:cellulose synthase/poly-beta-1,6-N-acetylglucosamine synthase-like glycosyltransferase